MRKKEIDLKALKWFILQGVDVVRQAHIFWLNMCKKMFEEDLNDLEKKVFRKRYKGGEMVEVRKRVVKVGEKGVRVGEKGVKKEKVLKEEESGGKEEESEGKLKEEEGTGEEVQEATEEEGSEQEFEEFIEKIPITWSPECIELGKKLEEEHFNLEEEGFNSLSIEDGLAIESKWKQDGWIDFSKLEESEEKKRYGGVEKSMDRRSMGLFDTIVSTWDGGRE